MKKIVLVGITIVIILILIILGLQRARLIKINCVNNQCPLGGTCTLFENENKCLMGYKDGSICNYCSTKSCNIGESFPLSLICIESNKK